MKPILISIFLLFFNVGCSKDSPTSTEPTEPTLDTTAKQSSATWVIWRYDGGWRTTADSLTISTTWRLISYLDRADGGVEIKGGYTFYFSNPTDNDVNFVFHHLTFDDKYGIRIYEYNLYSSILTDVEANSTATYAGSFEMWLDNIDVANQITLITPEKSGPAAEWMALIPYE